MEEELELGWELVLGVEAIGEINSTNTAVSVDLNSKGLNIVGTVSTTGEIGQVELDLIPAFIKSHGHSANKGLYTGGRLVVGGSESTTQVLDDHDQEGELDGKGLLGVDWARDEVSGHVGS